MGIATIHGEVVDLIIIWTSKSLLRKPEIDLVNLKLVVQETFHLLVLIGILIWLATGFYRVEPDEQGVELLFGKWNNQTTEPGLHYFFPSPIGQTITPKVEVIRKINVGFRSASDLGFSSNTNAEEKLLKKA